MKKFITLLMVVTLIYSCTPVEDSTNFDNLNEKITKLETIKKSLTEENENLKEKLKDCVKTTTTMKIWDGYEMDIPSGIVIKMDYAHGNDTTASDMSNNYISIRQPNGICNIKRDVDVDIYLNLSIGDSVQ